jgi:hypothetical protein
MTPDARGGKLYAKFTLFGEHGEASGQDRHVEVDFAMVALAAAMFVALFGFGASYFGWSDPEGKVRLALFTTFVLGIICGYKTKG